MSKTITIKRKNAWVGMACSMLVNIDGDTSIKLSNGAEEKVKIKPNKKEIVLEVSGGMSCLCGKYHIKNIQHVSCITLSFSMSDIKCDIEYDNKKEEVQIINQKALHNGTLLSINIVSGIILFIIIMYFLWPRMVYVY